MQKLHYQICQRLKDDADFNSFVKELPLRFEQGGETLYNQRNVIKVFGLNGQKIVVKRFKKLSFFTRFIYTFFRASKARRAFRNALELQKRNIDTPEALAFAEEAENGLMTYGYFISAANFSSPIAKVLYHEDGSIDYEVAEGLGRFMARLHQQGILHHDLNNTNVLFKRSEDGGFNFSLIDINRMEFHTPGSKIAAAVRYENLSKYCANMALHQWVAQAYANEMGDNEDQTVADMLEAKRRHDMKWHRKKNFKNIFKSLFKKQR